MSDRVRLLPFDNTYDLKISYTLHFYFAKPSIISVCFCSDYVRLSDVRICGVIPSVSEGEFFSCVFFCRALCSCTVAGVRFKPIKQNPGLSPGLLLPFLPSFHPSVHQCCYVHHNACCPYRSIKYHDACCDC